MKNLKITLREAAFAAIGVVAGAYGVPPEKVQATIALILSILG